MAVIPVADNPELVIRIVNQDDSTSDSGIAPSANPAPATPGGTSPSGVPHYLFTDLKSDVYVVPGEMTPEQIQQMKLPSGSVRLGPASDPGVKLFGPPPPGQAKLVPGLAGFNISGAFGPPEPMPVPQASPPHAVPTAKELVAAAKIDPNEVDTGVPEFLQGAGKGLDPLYEQMKTLQLRSEFVRAKNAGEFFNAQAAADRIDTANLIGQKSAAFPEARERFLEPTYKPFEYVKPELKQEIRDYNRGVGPGVKKPEGTAGTNWTQVAQGVGRIPGLQGVSTAASGIKTAATGMGMSGGAAVAAGTAAAAVAGLAIVTQLATSAMSKLIKDGLVPTTIQFAKFVPFVGAIPQLTDAIDKRAQQDIAELNNNAPRITNANIQAELQTNLNKFRVSQERGRFGGRNLDEILADRVRLGNRWNNAQREINAGVGRPLYEESNKWLERSVILLEKLAENIDVIVQTQKTIWAFTYPVLTAAYRAFDIIVDYIYKKLNLERKKEHEGFPADLAAMMYGEDDQEPINRRFNRGFDPPLNPIGPENPRGMVPKGRR